jgi:hypothetical protein
MIRVSASTYSRMVWPVAGRLYEDGPTRLHARMQRHLPDRQDAGNHQDKTVKGFGQLHEELSGAARRLFRTPRSTVTEAQSMAIERSGTTYLMRLGSLRADALVVIR